MSASSQSQALIEVSIADQRLRYRDALGCLEFSVSTALRGAGEKQGSLQTPRGWHRVRACIGGGAPVNTIFVGRRPQGIYTPELAAKHPEKDWILTRILWLQGLEIGVNRLGEVDSQQRYIYIHGTPDSEPMGQPRSHGCIRMHNQDLLQLFDRVSANTLVWIQEHSFARIPCCTL